VLHVFLFVWVAHFGWIPPLNRALVSVTIGPQAAQTSSEHDDNTAAATADCGSRQSGTSSSTVSELEAAVRCKDAELRRLRETMEQNETAIMQVCIVT